MNNYKINNDDIIGRIKNIFHKSDKEEKLKKILLNDLKYASDDNSKGSSQDDSFSSAQDEARMQDNDKARLVYWEIKHHEEDLKDQCSAREMREGFAKSAFRYLSGYSIACLCLLFLEGLSFPNKYIHFSLSDGVLLALVGSTAVSVLGLVGIVLSGLFKK